MAKQTNTTRRADNRSQPFGDQQSLAALLLAFCPTHLSKTDFCPIATPFTIGRNSDCDLMIEDEQVSKYHACIARKSEALRIEDLNSTNGTYVNGVRLSAKLPLSSPAVIRIAQVVLIFHNDARSLIEPPVSENYGIAGRFHTRRLLQEIREAALSNRHILLTGPSGTGKELSAKALARIMGEPGVPLNLVVHNSASFASESEAKTALFGLKKGVFTGVEARKGLLEQADHGVLFLDEVHNLPNTVQRSLLRVAEEGEMKRIGEERRRPVRVRLVLSSNMPGPLFGLAHDLLSRLRVIQIPPLTERVADIPAIFDTLLHQSLMRQKITVEPVMSSLGADHYETLCIDGFVQDNVRGLIDLADRISTKIRSGVQPAQAVADVFSQRFADSPLARRYQTEDRVGATNSHYQNNKERIIATYNECGGNISETMRRLNSQSIRCSRPWLAKFLQKWGVRD